MWITSNIWVTVQIVDIKILEWKCEPFTSYHQYRYSPHCPFNICYDKENLFDNQELLNLVVKGLILYTLTSILIFSLLFSIHFLKCWQGEFIQQSRTLVGDHFLYSCGLNVWFRGDIVRRNGMCLSLGWKD